MTAGKRLALIFTHPKVLFWIFFVVTVLIMFWMFLDYKTKKERRNEQLLKLQIEEKQKEIRLLHDSLSTYMLISDSLQAEVKLLTKKVNEDKLKADETIDRHTEKLENLEYVDDADLDERLNIIFSRKK